MSNFETSLILEEGGEGKTPGKRQPSPDSKKGEALVPLIRDSVIVHMMKKMGGDKKNLAGGEGREGVSFWGGGGTHLPRNNIPSTCTRTRGREQGVVGGMEKRGKKLDQLF